MASPLGRWSVAEVPALRGYAVEWLEPGTMVLSRRRHLYMATADAPPRLLASIPAPLWRRAAARLRPAQRLLRHLVYNVVRLADGSFFVTFDRSVGVVGAAPRSERAAAGGAAVAAGAAPAGAGYRTLAGLVRPCRVLRGAAALHDDGCVYFGEYLGNPGRGPVRVYRYAPGEGAVDVVHEFPAGHVRHIHGIYHDPHTSRLWCLTGDFGDECRILYTEDGFHSVHTLGAGDESWRCVSLLFTATHLYYATDAEFDRNRVYCVDRATSKREQLGELDGPTYYTTSCGEDLFFAVTAELCPSQVGRTAALWRWGGDARLERLAVFAKDRLPVSLFLPGTLHFPRGPGLAQELFFHGVGLQGADNRTFRVRRVD